MAANEAAVSVLRNASGRDMVDAQLAPGVEAVPPEPQETGAERDQGNAVGALLADLAPADEEHRGQCRHTGYGVDDDPSGEVEDTPLLEKPSAPDHMDGRKIDEKQPDRQEHHIRPEPDPVGEGARDQGRGDDREHHLIGDEHQERDIVGGREDRLGRHAAQEGHLEVPDDAPDVAGEAHGIADREPDDRGPAHGHEALDHDRQHVFPADQAAVKEGQARRHEHDQTGRHQHESRVARVEHLKHLLRRFAQALRKTFGIYGRDRSGRQSGKTEVVASKNLTPRPGDTAGPEA